MLNELMDEAGQVLSGVLANIDGRSADISIGRFNTRLVAALGVMAGPGDVLEIGICFGASVITTALMRQRHAVAGRSVALDPLDGRLARQGKQDTGIMRDNITGKTWDACTFLNNCKRNGVEAELVQHASFPWPKELTGRRFTVTYIDGDHWHDAPMYDWRNARNCTDRFIIFDDCDLRHPHVLDAVDEARNDPQWELWLKDGSIAVFEKRKAN